MTATVILEPDALEFARRREDYDALVAALREQGLDVTIRIGGAQRDPATAAVALIIYLAEHVGDAALTVVIEETMRRMVTRPSASGTPAPPVRRFVLVGADGDVIQDVEL